MKKIRNSPNIQIFGAASRKSELFDFQISTHAEKIQAYGAGVLRVRPAALIAVAMPREMFRTMLKRVERLRLAPNTG